ncbi:MAG: T9SS type A sorting domain-containing protein [Flavobacteriales bacterium]|nr:T9SS type A sorting domain-containing protein [Flavobacteriales bacterium]
MKKLSFLLITLCGIQVFAQLNLSKDSSFGNSGTFTTTFNSDQTITHSNTVVLQDDSILQIVSVVDNSYVFKLKPDGTLDSSFANNGKLELGTNNFLNIVLQGDKIIVYLGPKSASYNNNYVDSKIVRYHSNGTIDTTFGNNGVLNEVTESTNPQSLSVLVLADLSLMITNSPETYPKKYTKDGQLDSSFGANGVINYNYHYPIGQFSNGKITTCDVSSLSSSVFSFFDINSLATNTVLDLNQQSCHHNNGFLIQNKNNMSTRTTKEGMVYSVFEYQNYPLPDFSRLVVMKSESLDLNFNGEGFITSEDNEQFLDVGFRNKVFFVLNQKANQRSLNAYSETGVSLKINNSRDFALSSGHEIEMKSNYIIVNSIVSDANQNLTKLKIEKFLITNDLLTTTNILKKKITVENPVRDFLNVKNAENAESFDLYDMTGRKVLFSKSLENIKTSNLPRGNYILKINFKNGENFSHKLIKN